MPIRAKEKEMPGKGRKMAGFTRGGVPVDPSKVHAHPKQRKGEGRGKSFDGGQIGAIIGAGAITGIVGAAVVGGLREGFGGGGGGLFGNKKR
jgi:hypothetical protein